MSVNANEMVKNLTQQIREISLLAALATKVVDCNKSDDISEREAYKRYGKAWIVDRTKRGVIHFSRDGSTSKSRKTYSMHEIMCAKYAEKGVSEIIQISNHLDVLRNGD